MSEAIWVAVIGLGTGTLGSLVAPWANWGVEKRRERLTHRRALVKSWRHGISVTASVLPDMTLPLWNEFLSTPWYLSLEPHLTRKPGPFELEHLTAEVQRLERQWGLA